MARLETLLEGLLPDARAECEEALGRVADFLEAAAPGPLERALALAGAAALVAPSMRDLELRERVTTHEAAHVLGAHLWGVGFGEVAVPACLVNGWAGCVTLEEPRPLTVPAAHRFARAVLAGPVGESLAGYVEVASWDYHRASALAVLRRAGETDPRLLQVRLQQLETETRLELERHYAALDALARSLRQRLARGVPVSISGPEARALLCAADATLYPEED